MLGFVWKPPGKWEKRGKNVFDFMEKGDYNEENSPFWAGSCMREDHGGSGRVR